MKKRIIVSRIFQSLFLVLLFVFPFSMEPLNLFTNEVTINLLVPYKMPFTNLIFAPFYLLPIFAFFSFFTIFTIKHFNKLCSVLYFLGLTIYLIFAVTVLILNANTARWFYNLPIYIYLIFFTCVILHSICTFIGLKRIRESNPNYAEYKEIKKAEKIANKVYKQKQKNELKQNKKSAKDQKKNKDLTESKTKNTKIQKLKEKDKEETKNRIKTSLKSKVIFFVLGTIAIILFSFMFFILRGYKTSMTESVSDIGYSQAEQTASVYDSADGLYEKIQHFFEVQKESNSFTNSPYERIDIIITSNTTPFYIEKITDNTVLPTYDIFAYTTGKPSKIDMKDKVISKVKALDYVKRYKNGTYRKAPVYNKETGECKFYHPVTFGRKAGRKLVGFSVVTYREEVLMKTYYQTKVFVIAISVLFLYFGLFFTIFISEVITNPMLFLRSNVRKTANSIKEIVSGSAKVNPEDFDYEDCIKSNDEVKDLSVEIGNLVSLIRGIVPYISFSTLKNAEKESKRSYSRELCFLFTDIRGFTTMCEGLPPKDVVGILNHYLDIETQIILNNGGDIDKFVGDEMMAFFAGPKKEYNACKAAMEIRLAMRKEQQKSLEDETAYVNMGIGINTGKVVFGPIGSSTRMDFTSIGDTVNLAARLEGANKIYGSKTIITEAVYQKLNDSFLCRELDFITVKGKTEPVRIYEILQEKTIAEDKIYEIKDVFEKGLELYRAQQWKEAYAQFQLNAKKYNDYPSIIFMDRIKHFKKNPPPAEWDGVFVMKAK